MDPHAEYTQRLNARLAEAALEERRHRMLGNVRLVVALAAAGLAWLAFGRHLLSGWWLLVPGAGFVALMGIHERVIRARDRAARAARFYQRALARIEDRWAGGGESGDRFLDPAHPYAQDLDLFGKGSLFELLSTARTQAGEETLARWLLGPASPEVVRERQAAVEELRGRLDLREELALLGEEVRAGVHSEALAKWGEAPPVLDSRAARATAVILAGLAVVSLGVLFATGFRLLFLAVVPAEIAFAFWWRARVRHVVYSADQPGQDLALLSHVLARLEREPFGAPRLVELRAAMTTQGEPPSRRIARLDRLLVLLESRHNAFFAPIAAALLWATQLAFAIEQWRRESGGAIRRWLEAVGEMEALCALAGYAYEHPSDPFPEFIAQSPYFDGEALAHPLLPASRAVANDVRLDAGLRLLIVSGSNMSGKSTLLRTAGTNLVLAMAGAPVRARRLRLSPLAPGASIRVVDSLQGGRSRFYAEITRIRLLVDLARGPLPLLFLLDELLHGTNSHDRRIGAAGVVRALVERGGIGLITTHDLALADIAGTLSPPGANVHFQDHLEDGKISFDYRLRPGVVTKSNALELMRSVGLEV